MNIVYKKLQDLTPYHNNPRNNENAIDKVAQSIKEFGFKVPIIVDKNNVIVTGHTRYLASISLGIINVPCIVADDLTPQQIKAFRLADNKVSEFSNWNYELLELELESLLDFNFNLNGLGFDIDFDSSDPNGVFSSPQHNQDLDISHFDDYKTPKEQDNTPNNIDLPPKTPIIQYNIIFNDDNEQSIWYDFISYLKQNYDGNTISEKLTSHINEVLGND